MKYTGDVKVRRKSLEYFVDVVNDRTPGCIVGVTDDLPLSEDGGISIIAWALTAEQTGYRESIVVNRHWLNLPFDPAQIRDVALHECAHVLTPGHDHDEEWVKAACKLGVSKKDISDTLRNNARQLDDDTLAVGDLTMPYPKRIDFRHATNNLGRLRWQKTDPEWGWL